MARQNDKRIRLVKGADQLFYQQGINTTTLADIAGLADVPLGNVYYYFKSKESIILAVIENRLQVLQQLLDELNNNFSNPKERLKALLKQFVADQETITKFGDPLGSLCLELGKQPGELHVAVSDLMQKLISWCEVQFNALNISKSTTAKQLAMNFIASIQGISLLGITFKNLNNLEEHSKFLINWLDQIA